MTPNTQQSRSRPVRTAGFTLVELLVVITIVVLVSAVTLPTVLPALNHRQVSEAARILQAALVGARDSAGRENAPRGIRLLVDPVFNGSTSILAYNRFIPIKTAGDYSTGRVSISYPNPLGANFTPYVESLFPSPTVAHPSAIRVDEAPVDPSGIPNERTSWFWNVRIGDKIRFNDSGRFYTIVGPAVINPNQLTANLRGNPELFVNDGFPGTATQAPVVTDGLGNSYSPEYLYLVNGQDDPLFGQSIGDGFVDNGWDGFNNDYDFNGVGVSMVDEYDEWEQEQWTGTELATLLLTPVDPMTGLRTLRNMQYTISRRPTPVPGGAIVTLPGGVVVDATSWNTANVERSRLPIDPKTLYVDILINGNGQVVPTTEYSSPTASTGFPFYHFWLAERPDVHELSDLWGLNTSTTPPTPKPNPNTDPSTSQPLRFLLPMPESAYSQRDGSGNQVLTNVPTLALKGDRRLLTLFTRTGQLTSNTLEFFDVTDVNAPFYDAQSGIREAK